MPKTYKSAAMSSRDRLSATLARQGFRQGLTSISGYIRTDSRLGTVTLDADTFDMVKLLTSGQADKAQQKLKTLLALQNAGITGAEPCAKMSRSG